MAHANALQWLIVGGGIHGVHIATRLISEGDVCARQIRIVDPAPRLLSRWKACSEATGMSHLRSPSVHHVDVGPWSLLGFADQRKALDSDLFAPPYDRPSLALFNAHCDEVIQKHGLAEIHVQARAQKACVSERGVRVGLSDGQELTAHHIVLAIGMSEQPAWPQWADASDTRIFHIFQPPDPSPATSPDRNWPRQPETVAVVGGGISASQVALRLEKQGHHVHLISRHALRRHQFDSDPGWLGPKFMTGFRKESNYARRRTLISKARHRGSVPPDVEAALTQALSQKRIEWHVAEVQSLFREDKAAPKGQDTSATHVRTLRLTSGKDLRVDRVVLATGFRADRPGGALIDDLIHAESLRCADCGYPIVDHDLRWHPNIFVSGPLAELELGPSARNISGAREAGSRLARFARASSTAPHPRTGTRRHQRRRRDKTGSNIDVMVAPTATKGST